MSHYHINAQIGHCSTPHSRWRLSADSQSGEIRFLILRQAANTRRWGGPLGDESLAGRGRAVR